MNNLNFDQKEVPVLNHNHTLTKTREDEGPKNLLHFVHVREGKITFNPLGVNTHEVYLSADKDKPHFAKNFTPEYKGNPLFQSISFQTANGNLIDMTREVEQIYRRLVEENQYCPGPFGDIIRIVQMRDLCVITEIAQKAFPKPGLASDIIPVFKCKNPEGADRFFVLTGTRRFDPGMGKNATFGGFTAIERRSPGLSCGPDNPCVLDSDIYTAFKEAKEESGLRISVPNVELYREDYDMSHVAAQIFCGPKDQADREHYEAQVVKLGTIKTSDALMRDGGECLSNGEKRVYATTGFAVMINLADVKVDIEGRTYDAFLSQFKLAAADDMAGLQVHDITHAVTANNEEAMRELKSRLEFGIQHHNRLIDLLIPKVREFFFMENNG
ncbi:MAG: hypothetical protein ACH350_07375 [Parachlamydiaceae bacterium]